MIKTRNQLALKFSGQGVELGVARGDFSRQILEGGLVDRLWSIDRWQDHHDSREYFAAANILAEVGGNKSATLRMTFSEAAPLFADESLDFVYIDGYAHTGQDGGLTLKEWWPKLKPGGIFAGHDYAPKYPATIAAVDAFSRQKHLHFSLTTEDPLPSWWLRKPQSLPPQQIRTDNPIPPGATVCLVGNGPAVLRAPIGHLIDAHDVVVRFNWFAISGYEANVGTKTTIWSTFGRGTLPKDADQRPTKAIYVHGEKPKNFAYTVAEAWGIPRDFFDYVRQRVQAESRIQDAERIKPLLPTSGLVVALWLLECHGVDRLTLAGFDHFSKKESGLHHYWIPRAFKTPPEHDGEAEARLFAELVGAGKVVYLESQKSF